MSRCIILMQLESVIQLILINISHKMSERASCVWILCIMTYDQSQVTMMTEKSITDLETATSENFVYKNKEVECIKIESETKNEQNHLWRVKSSNIFLSFWTYVAFWTHYKPWKDYLNGMGLNWMVTLVQFWNFKMLIIQPPA